MIISHKHRFIFLCLPRTGTTAIRKELCDLYEGQPILYKHASYDVFLRNSTDDEKRYRVIASVRNPLDRTVSLYFKYLNNHDGIQHVQIKEIGDKNFIQKFILNITNSVLTKRARRVANEKMSFEEFFKEYYSHPYNDWHFNHFENYNFLIRFENLSEDFAKALISLGIEPIRELPIVNKTTKENRSFESYFTTEIIPVAQKNFFFCMEKYKYRFPENWPKYNPNFIDKINFDVSSMIKNVYWKYVR